MPQSVDLHVWAEDIRRIKAMFDATEDIHKTAQLHGSPLSIPILNESRYLARALIDSMNCAIEGKDGADGLAKARIAASSALNDAVDGILAITSARLQDVEMALKRSGLVDNIGIYLDESWHNRYRDYLVSYREIAAKVAESRKNRDKRIEIYLSLVEGRATNGLDTIIRFFQSLRELELFIAPVLKDSPVSCSSAR